MMSAQWQVFDNTPDPRRTMKNVFWILSPTFWLFMFKVLPSLLLHWTSAPKMSTFPAVFKTFKVKADWTSQRLFIRSSLKLIFIIYRQCWPTFTKGILIHFNFTSQSFLDCQNKSFSKLCNYSWTHSDIKSVCSGGFTTLIYLQSISIWGSWWII